jgi:hypothetical protein
MEDFSGNRRRLGHITKPAITLVKVDAAIRHLP